MNGPSSGSAPGWPTLGGGLIALILALGLSAPAIAQNGTATATNLDFPVVQPGEFTQERPYLVAEDPDTLEITPILTTGEVLRGTGYQMAAAPAGLGAYQDGDDVVVLMSHELTAEENEHISDARVSRLVLDSETGAALSGAYPVNGSEGYRSLSSGFLAGSDADFDQPVFLTGEGSTGGEESGIVIGVDGEGGDVTELPWLGHLPHASAIVIPGFDDQTAVFLTDGDTEGAEAYLYVADTPQDVLEGNGQLYVFVADDVEGTTDIAKGDTLSGRFEPIDEENNEDAEALQTAADDAGAFTFMRLEGVTYDRTDTTTIYFADTGENNPSLATPTVDPLSANGRLYSMTLDPTDPTRVTSLSVLLDGADGDDLRNPGNINANASTIMIQDNLNPSSREEDAENTGRILAYDIATGELTPLARIDQSDDPDRLVALGDEAGSWESSGIIEVSDLFGPGTWLVDVQAHTLNVPQFDGIDEGGQLLLFRQLTPEAAPTVEATAVATVEPTAVATVEPTAVATVEPTAVVTPEATAVVTEEPNVIEPEEPNVIEPEEPNVIEPEEPNVIEPEEPTVVPPAG
ncbi:MAG: DUF839 domain-containing protein [Chloroflexota bacterium]|nr:DUF839 domain-containing protein [Chloroflexota bacterium]